MPVPANEIIDAPADSNQRLLHKISKLLPMPQFVKEAALITEQELTDLPPQVFADPVNRKFPCHTKAATWLAQTYFLENKAAYTPDQQQRIQTKITKAAEWWGIGGQVKQAAAGWTKQQVATEGDLPDSAYALVVEYDGRRLRRWPINNPANIKAAATTLYNNRTKFPYDWRHKAAQRILAEAKTYNSPIFEPEIHEYLTKAAGYGTAAPKTAAEAIAYRMLMVPDKDVKVKTAAAKLAKAVAGMKGLPEPGEMVKLARIIDRLDREQGFYHYYGEAGLPMPEEIFFTLTEKKAAAIKESHVSLQTGTIIPLEALASLDLNKVADVMGADFAKAVMADTSIDVDIEKFAKIAATLPRNDAQLLERALAGAGLKFEPLRLEEIA